MVMGWFLLSLLVLGISAAPFFVLYLLVQHSKLRGQLNQLSSENSRQHATLTREVAELKKQLAGALVERPASASASKPVGPEVATPLEQTSAPRVAPPISVPQERRWEPAKQTIPPAAPVVEKRTEAFAEKPKDETLRITPGEIATTLKIPPPPKPLVTPPVAAEPKPLTPAAASPVSGTTVPVRPASPSPLSPAKPVGPISSAPLNPPRPVPPPPLASARVAAPSASASLRVSAPAARPNLQQRMKKVSSIEEALGTNWLNKLGIVILVVGVALFGIYELQALGPLGKVGISYIASLALLAGGIYLEKRETYRLLGRTGIGGGWALLFFSTYAMHHVGAMLVLSSEPVDLVLMLLVALAMAGHTLRYRSQFVTGLAFLLGYTTVALSHDNVYSLSAGVVLAIGLVAIVSKMGWFELEVFGILSSYLNHLYWLYRILGPHGAQGRHFEAYQASLTMLLFYWLTFRLSYVFRKIKTDFDEHVSTTAALLNTLLLLGLMKFQTVRPDLAWIALLVIGFVEFSLGQLPITRRRREAFVVLSVVGAALMITAVPFHYSGNNVAILWLVATEAFLVAGLAVKEVVFRRVGLLTGLLVGTHLVVIDFRHLMTLRMTSEELALSASVLFALCAIVFYLNALSVGPRWRQFFQGWPDSSLVIAHSYLGAFSAAAGVWALFAHDWTAIAFAGVMLVLAAIGQWRGSPHLQAQYAVLGALTMYRALAVNLHLESPLHAHVNMRLLTLPILGAVFYLTAKLAALRDDSEQRIFRGLFAAAGTALFTLLIWCEVPEPWIAVAWISFAAILVLSAKWIGYAPLAWQANVIALFALVRTYTFNYGLEQNVWHGVSLRMITVGLVAAGLYFISRKGAPEEQRARAVAFVHSFAATALLTLLAWYEAPNGWLAPIWATFALVLALVDRRWELEELSWQVNALALLTVARSLTVNLEVTATWHNLSVRLVSLAIVAVVLYALSRLIRMPESWRARDLHHIYSWAASTIVSLMLWYELKPLSVAVGWAVFGLVLFEYGLLRKITQLRYQAYIALMASFARIFFANLAAGEAGVFWGPRMYTILPLALIFFFVYAQSSEDEEAVARDRRWHFDVLLGYLGTGSIVALFYFQFHIEWVVTSWAALVFVLFGLALALNRPIFLHQGLLLTVSTFARGMAHNLFGAGYFGEGDWTGRYFVLGSAVAILMASLALAFPLSGRYVASPNTRGIKRALALVVQRPEQLEFFAPVILLTFMLALKMRAGMVTVAWGIEGVLIILLALALKERSFRLTGLGLLLLCVGKVMGMDAWGLQPRDRYLTFIIVGVALLVVSFLYTRYRDTIRQFL